MEKGGTRNKGIARNSTDEFPLLTVITVVRNCEQYIEETILSVLNQNYANIEYIIIDGNSNDSTLDIIRTYDDKIDLWISEPDKGIYDAMNKGIGLATGFYVNFMNAGDLFYNLAICQYISDVHLTSKDDVIYGDFIAKNDESGSSIIINAKPLSFIWKGMIFSHQSCFCKLELLKCNLFSLEYKIAADYNQILALYLSGKSFCYLKYPFSIIRTEGLSYSNCNTYLEEIKILHSRKPYTVKLIFFFIPLIFSFIKKLFGLSLTRVLRKFKWNLYIKMGIYKHDEDLK